MSLSIYIGEMLALVGESGSGKTLSSLSVMQLLNNFSEHLDGGEITYSMNNKEVALHQLSEQEMQPIRSSEIAMIFQEPMTALNPSMTCGAQVCEAINEHLLLNNNEVHKKCLDLFEAVELPQPNRIFDAYPHQLSGGQKQRVMIAMALSCEPKLLIADEPTTALDVTVQKEVLALIKKLQQRYKMACLFISHDLALVRQVADRIVVMQYGKVVESKPTAALFSNPEHPYTKALIACRPNLNRRLKLLPTVRDFLSDNFDINDFYIKNSKEAPVDYTKKDILLEVDKICKTYNSTSFMGSKQSVRALKDVSLRLFEGESLGLVGESGSGKSTLSKCIVHLESYDSGSIYYDGACILSTLKKEPLAYRKSVQMIFQDPASALNPRITVGATIVEVMKVHSIGFSASDRKQKALTLLEDVGLSSIYFSRYPHTLSGGQKQRVGIARALALEPKVIICDESVSALDVSVQAQVLNLLNDIKEKFKLSYIFISHDLAVVKHFCDRIVVLNNGCVEEVAATEVLFNAPKSIYTKSLIDAIPR